MNSPKKQHLNTAVGGLALALALSAIAPSAHANVYASNIKINDALLNASADQGSSVNISYILNEDASAGVTISVLSGSSVVRTINIAGGEAGTTRGLNTVVWDGKNDTGSNVPGGSYSVSVTAASTGYTVWTTTTSDANEGNYVWEGRAIAVNQNTNSPYYGRVFVSNAQAHSPGIRLGDKQGILKMNADGSYADEGGFSTGGRAWPLLYKVAPWKVEVSADDYVYVADFYNHGEIFRWDQTLSTDSQLSVLRSDNWATGCDLSGPAIVGTSTNTEIWYADAAYPSQGLVRYGVTEDGTCALNDIGTVVIPISYPLSTLATDVAVDKDHHYYIIESRSNLTDSSPRVMRYPNSFDQNTNAVADWNSAALYGAAAQNNDWAYASGVAVDPTGTYLAVSFRGNASTSGNTRIFEAATGTIVTNLDLGMAVGGSGTGHQDWDCCWDAVGNVYYTDNWWGAWRAVSPPGANSSTTKPPVVLEITAVAAPIGITSSALAGAVFTLDFTAGAGDAAADFEVLSSETVDGTYTLASGQNITGSSGAFQATIPASAGAQFYKLHRR